MTTIAFRDGILAADSAICGHHTHYFSAPKIVRAPDGACGGVAGTLEAGGAFTAWMQRGRTGELPDMDESEAFIFLPDRSMLWMGQKGGTMPIPLPPFVAYGSGAQVALGAMFAGATAREAVAASCEFDIGTRGPILTLDVWTPTHG